jgi:hypothetical protein
MNCKEEGGKIQMDGNILKDRRGERRYEERSRTRNIEHLHSIQNRTNTEK